MKIKFFAIALAALSLIACEKTPEPIVPEEADYTGTLTVEASTGTVVDNESRLNFTPSEDGATADIVLFQAKFAPRMPLRLDTTISGITLTSTPEKIILSGDGIIPTAMGGIPFEDYKISDLKGEIVGDKISLSLTFGSAPATYVGKLSEAPAETEPAAK